MTDQLIAKARTIQQQYRTTVEGIRNDRNLSPQGKREKLAAAYRENKTQLDALKQQRAAAIDKQQQDLRRSAFGLSYPAGATEADKEQIRMSYRDALGRVSGISSAEDALQALQQAQVVGDRHMVKAIAQVAYDKSWSGVLDVYSSISPSAASAMRELTQMERNQADTMGQFGAAMMFNIDAPREATNGDLQGQSADQAAAG